MPWILAGALGAIALTFITRGLARRREAALYAAGLMIAGLIYLVPALAYTGWSVIAVEFGGFIGFTSLAVLGWRRSGMGLALGWALHVGWDLWAHAAFGGGFMPQWYRWGCAGFDLVVAGYVLGKFAR